MKFDYPNCDKQIVKEDESLINESAKFCKEHSDEFDRLVENSDNDIASLLSFMVKTDYK